MLYRKQSFLPEETGTHYDTQVIEVVANTYVTEFEDTKGRKDTPLITDFFTKSGKYIGSVASDSILEDLSSLKCNLTRLCDFNKIAKDYADYFLGKKE